MRNTITSIYPILKYVLGITAVFSLFFSSLATGESFRVQCPSSTSLHPAAGSVPSSIKHHEIAGGSGAILFSIGIAAAGFACAEAFAFAAENGSVAFSNIPTDDHYAPTDDHYTLMLQASNESTRPTQATVNASPILKTKPYADIVEAAARANNLEEALLHAVIATESGYNPLAVSIRGASGLMQLMPQTAKHYGVNNCSDPSENIRGGARHLRHLLKLFNNNLPLALAAYNAGEGTVARFGNKVPPYRETIGYVNKVMTLYGQYRIAHL